jgi:hypothetical protein
MALVIACAGRYLFVRPLTSTLHANHPSLMTVHVRLSAFLYPPLIASVVLHKLV